MVPSKHDPLYDLAMGKIPGADTPGKFARHVVRSCGTAVLATRMTPVPRGRPSDEDAGVGGPFASLVLVACDYDACPILLISTLADHTRNLQQDGRVSLLFDGTRGLEEPLTGARVTLMGRAQPSGDAALRRRYLSRHPDAKAYVEFSDFHFYRITVSAAHLVAGFGEIHWIASQDFRLDTSGLEGVAEAEEAIVAHVNQAHAGTDSGGAEDDWARRLGFAEGDWTMTGCDPEGCDIRCGGDFGRFDFPDLARNRTDIENALVELQGERTS